jgi:hypothetical protein
MSWSNTFQHGGRLPSSLLLGGEERQEVFFCHVANQGLVATTPDKQDITQGLWGIRGFTKSSIRAGLRTNARVTAAILDAAASGTGEDLSQSREKRQEWRDARPPRDNRDGVVPEVGRDPVGRAGVEPVHED